LANIIVLVTTQETLCTAEGFGVLICKAVIRCEIKKYRDSYLCATCKL